MGNEYEVKITRYALEQMGVIVHYISYDIMAPSNKTTAKYGYAVSISQPNE